MRTVKRVDHRRLSRAHGAFDAGEVRRLVMDEFALHKGHRYATVIMDAERTRVLWVGEGNSREAIRPFFAIDQNLFGRSSNVFEQDHLIRHELSCANAPDSV